MKHKPHLIPSFFIVFTICSVLLGMQTKTAKAVNTCTWIGTTTDWHEPSNWSNCLDNESNPIEPGSTDDVIIGSASAYPSLSTYHETISIGTLEIQTGCTLEIAENVNLNASQVTNNGTIQVTDVNGNGIHIYSPFNNNGVVNINSSGFVALHGSGTHSGDFLGKHLSFPDSTIPDENVFTADSSVNTTSIFIGENRGIRFLGNLSIASGSSLSGDVIVEGNLINAGTVKPGQSPGVITVDGNFEQQGDGSLFIELGGTSPESEYDQLQIAGTATFSGTLDITLIDGFTPINGQSFTLITYDSHNNEFSMVNLPDFGTDLKGILDYQSNALLLLISDNANISGTVSYSGSIVEPYDITISLHEVIGEAPVASLDIINAGPYTFENVPDGSYYVSAHIDVDHSGGPPDPDEPFGYYTGSSETPQAVVMSGGTNISDIDISLEDPATGGSISGTATYSGSITEEHDIIVSLFTNVNNPPIESIHISNGDPYVFEDIADGTYYVNAFLDVDDSGGGPPDEGEPLSWYADQDDLPLAIVISGGNTVADIDIFLEDPLNYIFLPMIIR